MLVVKAINFAFEKHRGQERRGNELPYAIHPVIVSQLIAKYKSGSSKLDELQCAGLLHDVLEDTDTSVFEIEREFGSLVASITQELTSDPVMVKKIGKNEYLKQKMVSMSKYAFVLKLLDRYSNILDSPGESYVKKTINMMDFLLKNRVDITERQIRIILDIKETCKELQ